MVEKSSRTSKIAASVLVMVNLVVMVFCAIVFAISLWMIASGETLSQAIQYSGSATLKALFPREVLSVHLAVGLAVLATFMFFVSFMGLCGAFNGSQFMLFMYSTLVLLLLLLECALLYYFSSSLLEKGLQEADGQWTHALRLVFGCCEHNYTAPEVLKPPWSCCGADTYPGNCTIANVYRKNCQEAITTWLHRYQSVVYTCLAATHTLLAGVALVRRRS